MTDDETRELNDLQGQVVTLEKKLELAVTDLELARTELTILSPRLTPAYRANVALVIQQVTATLLVIQV